jgi:hypothetical protein
LFPWQQIWPCRRPRPGRSTFAHPSVFRSTTPPASHGPVVALTVAVALPSKLPPSILPPSSVKFVFPVSNTPPVCHVWQSIFFSIFQSTSMCERRLRSRRRGEVFIDHIDVYRSFLLPLPTTHLDLCIGGKDLVCSRLTSPARKRAPLRQNFMWVNVGSITV